MKNISLDLSGKIDSLTVDLLTILKEAAKKANTDFFVTGAAARDLILEQGYGISSGRKTQDVDLGVMVNGWDAYNRFKEMLISTGHFVSDKKVAHRLLFKESLPIDMIPFGKIESPPGSIAWPPDQMVRMKVLGFQEVMDHCLTVRLHAGLEIAVAPLAGMAVLKLIAWNERRSESREKDVTDLALLLRNYVQAGNMDRLYDEHADLLAAEEHDHDRAGARLLGQDMSRLMSQQTRKEVLTILHSQTDPEENDLLIIALSQQLGMDVYEKARILLECLTRGIEETSYTEEK